jgi:beta-lactamase regulating signal transducer with metallopeptidase domain
MMAMFDLLTLADADLWSIAGWTMVHFLWLGALVGVAAGACRLMLRRANANLRYAVMVVSLAALVALPVGIAAWLVRNSEPSSAGPAVVAAAAPMASGSSLEPTDAPAAEAIIELHRPEQDGESNDPIVAQQTAPGSAGGSPPADVGQGLRENPRPSRGLADATASSVFATTFGQLESWIAYLPWLWIVGTPVTFGLLATGVIGGRRLRRASRPIEDGPIAETLARLLESLRITRRVTVAVCERIAAPVLIGIVRPLILLPPSALTGWSPDEIEMVLLHELAHVRRWDNLVNLLQRFVESLLFFHPAVWLVSSWIRRERETCCDAVVVGRTNRPHAYAEMLVALAAQMPRSVLFHPAASSAMAAGPLRSRIRRILQVEDDPMLVSGKSLTVVLASLLVATTLAVLYVPTIGHAEQATTGVTKNVEAPDPKSEHESTADEVSDPVTLSLFVALKRDESGNTKLYVNGKPTDDESIQRSIPRDKELADKVLASITAENDVQYADIIRIINLLKSLKIKHISFDTHSGNALREDFKAQFTATENNPLELRNYAISDSLLKSLPVTLDGLKRDSADCSFEYELQRNGVAITAAKDAHDRFFGQFMAAFNAGVVGPRQSDDTTSSEKESLTNMKRIALAIMNYQMAHKTLPPQAICDATGRPLLSWRVAILPYLEEAELYNEFRRDEPWDSEHNRKLIARMPAALRNSMLKEPGKTNYLAVVGSECAFNGSPKGLGFASIPDGTSNTIEVVEANPDQAVEWTRPQDWNFDRNNPLKGLGAAWPDGWHAAYVDGHIKKFTRDAPPDTVGIAFTRRGGEQKSLSESAYRIAGVEGGIAEAGPAFDPAGAANPFGGLPAAVAGGEGGPAAVVNPLGRAPTVPQPIDNPFAGPPGSSPLASNPFAASPEGDYGPRPEDFGPNADAAERRRFPSLEEQKLADLAYKRLGLELEAIGAEDLKRVRALGYDGGVKVTQSNGSLTPNDILVGLHVWPTTSIQDVADVLGREDLAELTPLKYYAVRQEMASSPEHPNGVLKGFVRTGRIPVQPESRSRGRAWGGDPYDAAPYNAPSSSSRPRTPTSAAPATNSTAPTFPTDASPGGPLSRPSDSKPSATVAPTRPSQPATRYAAPTATNASKAAADAAPVDESLAPTPRPSSSDPPSAANERSVLADRTPRTASQPTERPQLDAESLPPTLVPVDPASPRDKSVLRYDGKAFGTWRETWKTELSTEKRLEAIKALAAFARAGYGKEAVEAILDVAGEYDFYILDSSPEGKLKEVVLDELVPSERKQSLATYWVPGLSGRYDQNPKQWKWLAIMLLSRLQTDDPDVLGLLRSLAASDDSQLRGEALSALVRAGRSREVSPPLDEATRKLIDSALASGDTNLTHSTLLSLIHSWQEMGGLGESPKIMTKVVYRPSNLPFLLFHKDEQVRLQARRIAKLLDQKDADELAKQLTDVLNDDSRVKDHISALRALAALGVKAKSVTPALVEILTTSEELPTRDAATVALVRCSGKQAVLEGHSNFNCDAINEALVEHATKEQREQILKKFNAPREALGSGEERIQRLTIENNAILPPESQNLGGGGFF